MTGRTVETSPQLYARIGGVLYLIIIVAGGFAELFVQRQTYCAERRCSYSQQHYGL